MEAFLLGFIALLPLLVFGFISLNKGSFFLPNSLLVKSESFSYSNPLQLVYNILFERFVSARNRMAAVSTQRLVIITPILYFLFRRFLKPSYSFVLMLLFGSTVLQLAFASTGYLYRYEAYLFFNFMVITPLLFHKYGRLVLSELNSLLSRIIALGLVFFLFFPVVLRSITALDKIHRACINIYDQQYQMAAFTKAFYNNGTVALNDIGAVSYFTNARIVDLWGLASMEVAKSRRNQSWTPAFLDSLSRTKRAEFVMVYDVWFSDSLTSRWDKIATWQIEDNVICGDDVVSFYSVDPSKKDALREQLKIFEAQLPHSVLVRYY